MDIRKLLLCAGIFIISAIALLIIQGTFCLGTECNSNGDTGILKTGGVVVNPTSTIVSGGVEYVPVTYLEEKEDLDEKSVSETGDGGSGSSEVSGNTVSPIVSASVTSVPESSLAGSGTTTGNSNGGMVNSLPVIEEDCYGAEDCNPTGDPIGGGAGYSRIISQTDPRVKYVVSTKEQLLSALANAKSGEVVFVKGTAVIDMDGTSEVVIPAGVTLASDRGLGGSSGALIKKKQNFTTSWNEAMFLAKNGARITGLQIEGEMKPQDYDETPDRQWLVGLHTHENMEVDNCDIRGWSCAGVLMGGNSNPVGDAHIHHNYIHENQAKGLGDGILVYGGDVIIESNIFDYNRHSIAAAGVEGESYEARYNIELGHGNPNAHRWDVHPNPFGEKYSGDSYVIHHNTFYETSYYDIKYRGDEPESGIWIDHNVFTWSEVNQLRPVFSHAYSLSAMGKTHVTDNYIGIPPTILKTSERGIVDYPAA